MTEENNGGTEISELTFPRSIAQENAVFSTGSKVIITQN